MTCIKLTPFGFEVTYCNTLVEWVAFLDRNNPFYELEPQEREEVRRDG